MDTSRRETAGRMRRIPNHGGVSNNRRETCIHRLIHTDEQAVLHEECDGMGGHAEGICAKMNKKMESPGRARAVEFDN